MTGLSLSYSTTPHHTAASQQLPQSTILAKGLFWVDYNVESKYVGKRKGKYLGRILASSSSAWKSHWRWELTGSRPQWTAVLVPRSLLTASSSFSYSVSFLSPQTLFFPSYKSQPLLWISLLLYELPYKKKKKKMYCVPFPPVTDLLLV